jgi:3-phosphoinositide dependent protein kinase-1
MISGHFAFNDRSDYLTWQKIKKVEYEFPTGFDEHASNLVENLLVSTADPCFSRGLTFDFSRSTTL